MAKRKMLALTVTEFETVYRVLITSPTEGGLSQLRTLTDLLDWMEDAGFTKAEATDGAIPLYTVLDDVTMPLSSNEETTFKTLLTAGITRYQAWAVRPLLAVLDRLADAKVVDPKE